MQKLSFATLREANTLRVLCFKNAKGEIAHPGGVDDWALSKWSNAVTGELGEAANMIKKIERGDYDLDDEIVDDKTGAKITVRAALAKELADVVCYLDLLAYRARIDLGEATVAKFNEISRRVDASIYIRVAGGEYRIADDRYVDTGRSGDSTAFAFVGGDK